MLKFQILVLLGDCLEVLRERSQLLFVLLSFINEFLFFGIQHVFKLIDSGLHFILELLLHLFNFFAKGHLCAVEHFFWLLASTC